MVILYHNSIILLGFFAASQAMVPCDKACVDLRMRYERTASASRESGAKMGVLELYDDYVNWNEARKICMSDGGQLATIRSREEAEIMAKYNRDTDTRREPDDVSAGVFVGFHDFYHEGSFVTVRGEQLNETGYSTFTSAWGGQPDNGGVSGQGQGSQQCGSLAFDGGLDDVNCSSHRRFICEFPEDSSAPDDSSCCKLFEKIVPNVNWCVTL
ncbi:hypothetical protein QAD02_014742 [Eretmocerus hayati]|uniref:Uncharacterized protein n=1 Tax=Eretmocerus hayati TaxID=131215 RepID=A0ACC2P5V6_9HYME|nr:hypothetical protein QAD02_014742 [Eretmocerus hayati]